MLYNYFMPVKYISLSELCGQIKSAIDSMQAEYWVVAEIASVNVNQRSGHCYLELVEKRGESVTAQLRATIWSRVYTRMIKGFFMVTGRNLEPGMKVLMMAGVSYHEVYGLSLNVMDIDPQYTLGEMALKRRECIERLKKEGVFELNRSLPFPLVPQRIAVISSKTAAGYGDFMHSLDNNPFGYKYSLKLFEAFMQGDRVESSIINALDDLKASAKKFDICVIIRGGGGKVELGAFDSYGLCRAIALMPLPVITGIGHERDEAVADMVGNRSLKTPTAVAEFIISATREFELMIDNMASSMAASTSGMLKDAGYGLDALARRLAASAAAFVTGVRHGLGRHADRIILNSRLMLNSAAARMEAVKTGIAMQSRYLLKSRSDAMMSLETRVKALDPVNVLKRGYSITIYNGRPLKRVSRLKKGDAIETRLHKGRIISSVEAIQEGLIDEG